MHHEAHARGADVIEEALEEGVVLGDVIAPRGRLARAPEAREVRREAAVRAQEREPVVGAGGDAVQVHGDGSRGHVGAAPEDRDAVDLGGVLERLWHAARIR